MSDIRNKRDKKTSFGFNSPNEREVGGTKVGVGVESLNGQEKTVMRNLNAPCNEKCFKSRVLLVKKISIEVLH